MALSVSFVANSGNTTSSTAYSFSSLALGAAASDRRIVVAFIGQAGTAASALNVTIAGVSAAVLHRVQSSTVSLEFWIAAVPTGTSGNIAVTWPSSRTRCAVIVWRVVGGTPVRVGAGGEVNSGTADLNDAVDIPAGGVGISACYDAGTGSRSWTWSGLTEVVDTTFASGRSYSGASGAFGSDQNSLSVSATPSGSTTANVLAAISLADSAALPDQVYVGGKTVEILGDTSTANISLTDLTGGIASAPAAGDLVIIGYAIGTAGRDPDISITGYTEVADLFSDDTIDANLGVYWKVMGGTPDTQFERSATGNAADGAAIAVQVWRGIDQSNPMDVAGVTATGINSFLADPPSITPAASNAIVVAIGAGATTSGNIFAQAADQLANFQTAFGNDTNDGMIGMGSRRAVSGAFNPTAFTSPGGDSTNNAWCAVTLALRPAGASAPTGAAAVLFGPMMIAATGHEQITVAGQAAIALPGPTIAALGAEKIPGSISVSLGQLAIDATGASFISGAAAVAIEAVQLAVTGIVNPTGAAAIDLASIVLDAVGSERFNASAALDLGKVALDATGVMQPDGAADVALDKVDIAASGEQSAPGAEGAAAVEISALEVAAFGLLRVEAAAAVDLGKLIVDGFSGDALTGGAEIDLAGLTLHATLTERLAGAAALVLSAVALEAMGEARLDASADIQIAALILAGLGQERIPGAADVTFGPPEISGSAEERLVAAAGILLETVQLALKGDSRIDAGAQVNLGEVEIEGLGNAFLEDAASILLQAMIVEAIGTVVLPTSLRRVVEMRGAISVEELRGRIRRVLDFKGKMN